jgi:hypothetical protein
LWKSGIVRDFFPISGAKALISQDYSIWGCFQLFFPSYWKTQAVERFSRLDAQKVAKTAKLIRLKELCNEISTHDGSR